MALFFIKNIFIKKGKANISVDNATFAVGKKWPKGSAGRVPCDLYFNLMYN